MSIIFLEDKHKMLLHLSIFYEYQQFLSTPYLFFDTAARLQWPVTHFSTFYQFIFLIMLFNKAFSPSCWFHPSSLTDPMSRLHHNSFLQYRPFLICLNWRDFPAVRKNNYHNYICLHICYKLVVLFGACWRSDSLKNTFNIASLRQSVEITTYFYFRLICS